MTRFKHLVVWAGSAVFVISLAVCSYYYLVVWASPAGRGRWDAVARNTLLLTGFALHHSIFARDSIKRHLARVIPEAGLRSLYVWTSSLLLLVVLVLWHPVAGVVYNVMGWRAWTHAALQLLGLALIVRAVAWIDPLELAGVRTAPREAGIQALQTTGPYRWVRHPLYLGWVLVVFGAAHMTANRLVFAVVTTVYILVAIPWEERSLQRMFGAAYTRYRHNVPWRIVPYVY